MAMSRLGPHVWIPGGEGDKQKNKLNGVALTIVGFHHRGWEACKVFIFYSVSSHKAEFVVVDLLSACNEIETPMFYM